MEFGNLEQIFLIVLGIVILVVGIACLVFWLKVKRSREVIMILKIGGIAAAIVVIAYVAAKILMLT